MFGIFKKSTKSAEKKIEEVCSIILKSNIEGKSLSPNEVREDVNATFSAIKSQSGRDNFPLWMIALHSTANACKLAADLTNYEDAESYALAATNIYNTYYPADKVVPVTKHELILINSSMNILETAFK